MECVEGKLFVGGLKSETTEETLEQHFSKYGQVKDCQIMKDWRMGMGMGTGTGMSRSRRFAFVTFFEPSHAQQALHCRRPMIDGKMVEVKPAIPRDHRATPRDTRATINIYNTCTTGLEFGFGTGLPMYGYGATSGTYLPLVYCDNEGNPYYGGFCYYSASPYTLPLPNYSYVAPCVYEASMYTTKYYTSRGSHANGVGDHVNVEQSRGSHVIGGVGDDHVNVERSRGSQVNGGVGDHVNAERSRCSQVNGGVGDQVNVDGGVGDQVNVERSRGSHGSLVNGGVGDHVDVKRSIASHVNGGVGDHVNVKQSIGSHVNGETGDHLNVERAEHSNPSAPSFEVHNYSKIHANSSIPRKVQKNGRVDDNSENERNEKHDHASPSSSSRVQEDYAGNEDDYAGNEERANQSVNVSSRSSGNYDRPTGITPSVHMSYVKALITKSRGPDNHKGAEALITKSSGSNNHKGAMEKCKST